MFLQLSHVKFFDRLILSLMILFLKTLLEIISSIHFDKSSLLLGSKYNAALPQISLNTGILDQIKGHLENKYSFQLYFHFR